MIITLFIATVVLFALILALKLVCAVLGIVLPILSFSFGLIFRIFGGILFVLALIFLLGLIF